MRRFVLHAVALFVGFGLVCSFADVTTAQQKPKVLKIGTTLPLIVSIGMEAKKCYELLVADLNAAGGITVGGDTYQIEMIIYDDGYKADKGRAAVERLVTGDKVKFLVGPMASAPTLAGLVVTEPAKVIVFTGAATNKTLEPRFKYTVRTSTLTTGIPGQRMFILQRHPNIKTLVFVGPDDETGRDTGLVDDKIVSNFGIKKLDSIFFPRDTKEFLSIALKIKNLNPDMVYASALNQGNETGSLLKALHQAGYKGVKLGVTPDMDVIQKIASNEATEGYYGALRDSAATPRPNAQALRLKELYSAKYGHWNDTAVMWVGGWFGFLASVKKANSLDPDKIMAATANLEFDAPQGHFMLVKRPDLGTSRYCDSTADVNIGQIHNGKFEYVGTFPAQDGIAACEKVFGGGKWR